jgi:hypothetical protein
MLIWHSNSQQLSNDDFTAIRALKGRVDADQLTATDADSSAKWSGTMDWIDPRDAARMVNGVPSPVTKTIRTDFPLERGNSDGPFYDGLVYTFSDDASFGKMMKAIRGDKLIEGLLGKHPGGIRVQVFQANGTLRLAK